MDDAASRVREVLTTEHRDRTAAEIAAATDLGEPTVLAALETLVRDGEAVAYGDGLYLSAAAAERMHATVRRHLAAFHRKNPYRRVMPVADLAPLLEKAAAVRDLPALLAGLEAEGEVASEPVGVRLPRHSVQLPPHWEAPAEEILAATREGGLRPPPPPFLQRSYPRTVHVPTVLEILAEQGRVVRVAEEIYFAPEVIASAQEAIRRVSAENGEITVAALRDATDSTRKFIAPLLDYFDAVGFTRKAGERRVLAEQR